MNNPNPPQTEKLDLLRLAVFERNSQGYPTHYPLHFLRVLAAYWKPCLYLLKKFGWKSCVNFWFSKLFVSDEGGEYDLFAPFLRRWPLLLLKPYKIEFEHSTICDKKCLLCEHTYWQEKAGRISLGQVKGFLEPVKTIRWANVTGEGSGLLNKDFLAVLKYLRRRGICVNFVDEFDFLDERVGREIIEMGINSIYISFDGATKQTYETIKKGCDFDAALKNIKTFLKLKGEISSPFPVLHFRFVITTLNYREMPRFVELVASLGDRGPRAKVEFVGLLAFPGIEQYYMPIDDIPRDILAAAYETALKHGINLCMSHPSLKKPSMTDCVAWSEPYILIGGEVISCCAIIMSNNRQFLREHSFGNVYKQPLMDIWNSEKYKTFRERVGNLCSKVPKTCHGCRAYDTQERAAQYGIED